MEYIYDDGGRKQAGYKGTAGDCVVRAICIAAELPYKEVYEQLSDLARQAPATKRCKKKTSARNGVYVKRKFFKDFMHALGFVWTPTMGIGTGCTVHLTDGELPSGRLVVAVSNHYTAVIDGVIRDNHDPQRKTHWFDESGKIKRTTERCVYGYWKLETPTALVDINAISHDELPF